MVREKERERESEKERENWTMILETKVGEMRYRSQLTKRTPLVRVYGRVPQAAGCRGEY